MGSAFLFGATTVLFLISSVFYVSHTITKRIFLGWAGTVVAAAGLLVCTAALTKRTVDSIKMGIGHAPFANLYESMVFFGWCIVLVYLLIEWKYKIRILGAFVMPLAFLGMAYVTVAPNISGEIEPLVPALKSYWLYAHVSVTFLGYAAFAVSFAVSMMYLLKEAQSKSQFSFIFGLCWISATATTVVALVVDYAIQMGGQGQPHLFAATLRNPSLGMKLISWVVLLGLFALVMFLVSNYRDFFASVFPSLDILDDLNYKTIAIGFPLLTLGIITGAAWAHYAWGTYWSWDPKETWSLITWFVYAAFLHARFTAGWRGRKTAILSVIGFASVIFLYLGVNLILSGLHSYA